MVVRLLWGVPNPDSKCVAVTCMELDWVLALLL